MKKLLAFGLLIPLAACAGRLPDPIEVEQSADYGLPCTAIDAEMAGNRAKAWHLADREVDRTAQNISVGTLGFTLFVPAYFGFDLSDANARERQALMERNDRLVALRTSRGCHVHDQAPAGYTVYQREHRTYEDEYGREVALPVNHYAYSERGAERVAASANQPAPLLP
jgi:hypothetical protein